MTTLDDAIARFPRVELLESATPIRRLKRIEKTLGSCLGGARLFVKRDDLMELGGGGNKLRKLEFLLGEARSMGANTIITTGGRQSNHARLTAAAAARLGMRCELVLRRLVVREDIEYEAGGNVFLDKLLGARVHALSACTDVVAFMEDCAATLRSAGMIPYIVPAGGSSAVGSLGYAACALEITRQEATAGADFRHLVLANGGSGTHAGLAAGQVALARPPAAVKSYSVMASEADTRKVTLEKARATLALINPRAEIGLRDIVVDGSQRGGGYGVATTEMVDAVRLMATCEGLLLDPVYSGKAFAGLLASARAGEFAGGGDVLFLMTGGTPALFSYRESLLSGDLGHELTVSSEN